jgi:hypothetical protein
MKKQVVDPIINIKFKAVSEFSNKGDILETMNTPAVTIVAA